MSHGTSGTVECPLCGEAFDPTAAGGWCTNSDCGEWQYEAAAPEGTDDAEATDDGADAAGPGRPADAETADTSDRKTDAPAATDGELDVSDEAADSVAAAEAGAGVDTSDTHGTEPAGSAAVGDESAGVGDDEPADAGDDAPAEPVADEPEAAVEEGADLVCPNCGESVGAEDNFCATCGEDLDAHRAGGGTGDDDDATADDRTAADAGAAAGDDAAASDAGAGSASETGAADSATEGRESLVLVVRNREVEVRDGGTVGKTIRSIVVNTGGDEEEARQIHREHVKFVREDGRFHLVALGRNPTVVNGDSLDEGERAPVSPGDRIELSGVASMRVEAP
jgi:hypothetical protein